MRRVYQVVTWCIPAIILMICMAGWWLSAGMVAGLFIAGAALACFALFFAFPALRETRHDKPDTGSELLQRDILLDTCPVGLVLVSGDSILRLNASARNMLSLEVGDNIRDAFAGGDFEGCLRQARQQDMTHIMSVRLYGPRDDIREVSLVSLQTLFQGQPVIALWMMDITTVKATEKALAEALTQAEAAARAKNAFLTHMSHEIRTPMNAMLGLAYLCLRTDLDPHQRDYLNRLLTAGHDLLSIFNNILDISQEDPSDTVLENELFRLGYLVEMVSSSFASLAEKKNLEFLVRVDPDLPERLIGDSLRLAQVLQILVSNALKFTERGSIRIAIEPYADPDVESQHEIMIHFSVSDTGIGMTEEQMERIFQPFIQGDSSSTRRFDGMGLGLAVAWRVIGQMGGRIWAESRPGAGSAFHVVVPLSREPGTTAARAKRDFSSIKALVVDDSEAAAAILTEQFAVLGCHADMAHNGQTAVEMVHRAIADGVPYHILLLDWRMPEPDGLETARRIWNTCKPETSPVMILVTGTGLVPPPSIFADTGLGGYLVKPVPLNDIEDILNRVLEEGKKECNIHGCRVLLVEDNEINQEIAKSLLEAAGVGVDVACNGEDAVKLMEKASPGTWQMIFMDIQMPIMDGLEATRRIRALAPSSVSGVPIVAMTAHARSSDRELSIAAGMSDHITKPLDPEEVSRALDAWIPVGIALAPPLSQQPAHHVAQPDTNESGRPSPVTEPEPVKLAPPVAQDNISPVLEEEAGLESVGGNRALYAKLLHKFLDSHGESDREVRQALEASDLELATREAHTIKGVAASLGLPALAAAASALEKELRGKDGPESSLAAGEEPDCLEPFAVELARAVEAVRTLLGDNSPTPDSPKSRNDPAVISENTRREIMKLAGNLVDNLERDWGAVMTSMEALERLLTETGRASDVCDLAVAVENFDIPQALKTAETLLETFSA